MNATKWTRALLVFGLVGLAACGGGEPAEEEVVEEAPAPAAPVMPEAPVLDATELQTNAAAHEGMTVRLNGMRVSSTLGTGAAWVELPNKNPFLVRAATQPAANSTVDIVGRIEPVTPEVVNEWVTAGAITEGERIQAEFATHYIAADMIQPSAGM
jgi:hypothetical protein